MATPDPSRFRGAAAHETTASAFFSSAGKWAAFLLLGFITGTFVFLASSVKLRYGIPFIGAILMPVFGVLTLRFKQLFQGLLILTLPLMVRKTLMFVEITHTGGPVGLDVLLVDFLLFVLYAVWLYEGFILKRPGQGLYVPRIAWYLLAFIGVAVLSTSNATEIRYSIFEIVRLVKVFFFLLYVVNHFRTEKQIRFAVFLLMVVVNIHAMVAFAQRLTGLTLYVPFLMPPPADAPGMQYGSIFLRRPGGIFGNSNAAAAFLSFVMPVVFITLFWRSGRVFKAFSLMTLLMGFAALVDTYSRAGWITIPPATVLLLYFLFKKKYLSLKRHIPAIALAGLVVIMVAAIYSEPLILRFTQKVGVSGLSRLFLMKVAAIMFINHPLVGHGVNNFNLSFVPFKSEIYDPHASLQPGVHHVVHNIFLLISVDMGILGIGLFLLILYEFGKNALRGIRSNDRFICVTSVGLLTTLQSFLLVENFDYSYAQYESILFLTWTLIGFSFCYLEDRGRAAPQPSPGPPNRR